MHCTVLRALLNNFPHNFRNLSSSEIIPCPQIPVWREFHQKSHFHNFPTRLREPQTRAEVAQSA
jgi:hypothetical protein